jgi:hypothetical protein
LDDVSSDSDEEDANEAPTKIKRPWTINSFDDDLLCTSWMMLLQLFEKLLHLRMHTSERRQFKVRWIPS